MQRARRRPWLGRNYAGSSSSLFPVSRVNSLTCRVSLGWWEHVRVPAPCLGPCGHCQRAHQVFKCIVTHTWHLLVRSVFIVRL